MATGRVESLAVSPTPDESYDAAVSATLPGLSAGLVGFDPGRDQLLGFLLDMELQLVIELSLHGAAANDGAEAMPDLAPAVTEPVG